MGLLIRSSKIHATGCYTTSAVKKGARVVEYTGERITVDEADELLIELVEHHLDAAQRHQRQPRQQARGSSDWPPT